MSWPTEPAPSRPLPPSTGLSRFRYKVGQPGCDSQGQGLCPGSGLCGLGDEHGQVGLGAESCRSALVSNICWKSGSPLHTRRITLAEGPCSQRHCRHGCDCQRALSSQLSPGPMPPGAPVASFILNHNIHVATAPLSHAIYPSVH